MSNSNNRLVEEAARLIREARHAVALTGAGISTASGIPDFRSPQSGLWSKVDPTEVASIAAFRRNPQAYYEWRRPLLSTLRAATPNPAHRALAELEQRQLLHAVITQNIDALHQRAGSRRVLEVHGRSREFICLSCKHLVGEDSEAGLAARRGEIPYCPVCGGLLKPNVVFFGEELPRDVLSQVQSEVYECDLMIVAGSSLEVQPACLWPREAIRWGAQVIIVNYQPTYLDEQAHP